MKPNTIVPKKVKTLYV